METVRQGTIEKPSETGKLPELLLVDDNPVLLRAMARMLGASFHVTVATSAEVVLRLLEGGQCFSAVVSDLYMPGTDGAQLHELLMEVAPALAARMVFMSGGGLPARLLEFAKGRTVLRKPISVSSLLAALAPAP